MGVNPAYEYSVSRRVCLMLSMLLILLLTPPPARSETLDQRVHRLETEVQNLRGALSRQKQKTASVEKAAPATKKIVSPASRTVEQSRAYVRYYIQNQPLGRQPPGKNSALASGRFSVPASLSFDPGAYDVANTGLFSAYRDPAQYAYVGLELQADMDIVEKGEYEFVVYPQPARATRDGGTNIFTRLSVRLSVGKQEVVSFQNNKSWHPQRSRITLTPGHYRLRLWAVASSDGFGPSPTDSRLRLAMKGPHDVSPQPLYGLQAPRQLIRIKSAK